MSGLGSTTTYSGYPFLGFCIQTLPRCLEVFWLVGCLDAVVVAFVFDVSQCMACDYNWINLLERVSASGHCGSLVLC